MLVSYSTLSLLPAFDADILSQASPSCLQPLTAMSYKRAPLDHPKTANQEYILQMWIADSSLKNLSSSLDQMVRFWIRNIIGRCTFTITDIERESSYYRHDSILTASSSHSWVNYFKAGMKVVSVATLLAISVLTLSTTTGSSRAYAIRQA